MKLNKTKNNIFIFLALFMVIFVACDEPYPRPSGYLRIEIPEQQYQEVEYCYFKTQISSSAKIIPIAKKDAECWFNLKYNKFKADVHFTYLPIEDNFADLVDHAHRLKDRHNTVASYIPETKYENIDHNVGGLLFEIQGRKAASPINFFLTDSTNHFVVGSLYFNHSPNNDSIQPVIEHIKEDVIHMMENWEWIQ